MKVSLTDLLTVLFVGLKLSGIIDWGWGLVLIFVWIRLGLIFILGVLSYITER